MLFSLKLFFILPGLVDGRVRLMGRYPTAAELDAWLTENDEEGHE